MKIRSINFGRLCLVWLMFLISQSVLIGATNVTIARGLLAEAIAEKPEQQQFLSLVLANDTSGVKAALAADKSLANATTKNKVPALIYATILGGDMPRILLENGASPNVRASLNWSIGRDHSPLDIAALLADADTTAVLLKAGATPNNPGIDKAVPLQKLFQNGSGLRVGPAKSQEQTETDRQAVARLLMAAGADPAYSGSIYGSAFVTMTTAQTPNWLAVLAESTPDPTKLVSDKDNLLHLAAKRGDGEAIRILLGRKLDPELRDGRQLTPLQLVSLRTTPSPAGTKQDPFEPVGYWNLMAAGAKVDLFSLAALGKLGNLQKMAAITKDFKTLRHENGGTLLHWATSSGQSHVIQWLLKEGLDPDATDSTGSQPLHLALSYKHDEAFHLLLPETKNLRLKDQQNRTPFTIVLEQRREQIFSELFKRLNDAVTRQELLNDELTYFVGKENPKIVETLLNYGATPTISTTNGQTALHMAVKTSPAQTKRLLELGLDANARDKQGRTPLLHAILGGSISLAAPLPVRQIPFNFGPLRRVTPSETLEIIKLLLEHGADIKAVDADGNNILHLAFQQQSAFSDQAGGGQVKSWLDFLLEQGAEPNLKNRNGQTPLQLGLQDKRNYWLDENSVSSILKSLAQHKFDLESKDTNGFTLLHHAMKNERPALATALLNNGADVNARTAGGDTPLLLRIKNTQSFYNGREVLPLLIKSGADAALLDNQGRSVWQILCEANNNSSDFIQQMLKAGINPKLTNSLGETALHLGAKHKLDDFSMGRLLQGGADPQQIDKQGRIPLHWIMSDNSFFRLSSPLLKATTNYNVMDLQGNTPLHLACLNNNPYLMNHLVTHGADATLKNQQGDTPLWLSIGKNTTPNSRSSGLFRGSMQAVHLLPPGITNDIINSAGAGDLATVKKLLLMEPRLLSAAREGHTALHSAAYSKHKEVVDYLLNAGAQMDEFTAIALGDVALLKNLTTKKRREAPDKDYWQTLTIQAARQDDPEIINWLATQGAKPAESIDPKTGISALGTALKLKNLQSATALRKYGAHPTPFDVVYLQQPDLASEAVQHHANWLNRTNTQGITALMRSLGDRNLDCTRALLENGADPNLESTSPPLLHTTTLQYALQFQNHKGVALLLDHKLDLNRPNWLGFTPLHLAAWYGSTNLLDYAIANGCKLDERQKQPAKPGFKNTGQTPLHLAVLGGKTNMIAYLLQKGAPYHSTNAFGQTPLELVFDLSKASSSAPSFNPQINIARAPVPLTTYPPIRYPTNVLYEMERLLMEAAKTNSSSSVSGSTIRP